MDERNQFPTDLIKRSGSLNLVDNSNNNFNLQNNRHSFEKDLMHKYEILERTLEGNQISMAHIYDLVVNYTLQLLISYHHNHNFELPLSLVQQTKTVILDSAYNCFEIFCIPDIKQQYIYDIDNMLLDKTIVLKNGRYMQQFE